MDRPVLIILTGLPGTGKTTFAAKLASALPAVVVESDRVRKILFPKPRYDAEENRLVHTVARALIRNFLKTSHSVISDATNLIEFHRRLLLRVSASLGVPALVVQITAPPEVVRNRLETRSTRRSPSDVSDATWEIYERMRRYDKAIPEPHLRVDTTRDLDKAVRRVVRAARQAARHTVPSY